MILEAPNQAEIDALKRARLHQSRVRTVNGLRAAIARRDVFQVLKWIRYVLQNVTWTELFTIAELIIDAVDLSQSQVRQPDASDCPTVENPPRVKPAVSKGKKDSTVGVTS